MIPIWSRVSAIGWACLLQLSAMVASGQELATDGAKEERPLEDYAEIYVDRYIEPDESLLLQEKGEKKSEAMAAYVMGLSKLKNDDLAGAIGAFERVLSLRPEAVSLAEKLAYLSARDGRPHEGVKVLEKSLEQNEDKVAAYLALSEFLTTYFPNNDKRAEKALQLAELAVERFPDDPNAYGHLVKMHIVNQDRDKAKTVMNRGLERENANPYYWLRMADIAKRVWPLRSAKGQEPVLLNKIYEKALERAGNSIEVRVSVANFYHASRQGVKARDLYEEIVAQATDRLDVRERLAKVYGALGQLDEMIETLKGIVRIDPQNVPTHKMLATLYQDRDEIEEAIYHRRQALRIAKGAINEYQELADLLRRQEQPEEAIRILKRGAYLYPESVELQQFLAGISMEVESWDDAVMHFEQVLDLGSSTHEFNKVFYFRYAIAAERSGDIDRATSLLQKSIEFLEDEDMEDEANRQFAATVYNYLGYTWVENDMNLDQGGALIKAALELDPTSGAITDSLGWFYFKKGEWVDSLKALLKAEILTEDPDGVIFDHIGRAYFEVGNREQAVRYMKRALELEPENEEFVNRLKRFETEEPPRVLDTDAATDTPAEEEAEAEEKPESKENPPAGLQNNAA